MIRRTIRLATVKELPTPGQKAKAVLGDNPKRIALTVFTISPNVTLYDQESLVATVAAVAQGIPLPTAFPLTWEGSLCPQGSLYAGADAVAASVSIVEVTQEDIG